MTEKAYAPDRRRSPDVERRSTHVSEAWRSHGSRGAVPQSSASSGRLLDPATQRTMASLLGHDFSKVKVHSGEAAADSARQLKARAYTVGDHVVLGRAGPNLHTRSGRFLLAHELAHVVQQRLGGPAPQNGADNPSEREAQAVATAVVDGRTSPPLLRGTSVGVAAAPETGPTTIVARAVPRSLTNAALLGELRVLERAGSTAAGGAEAEARYRALLVERSQRLSAGHLWLSDAGVSEFVQVVDSGSGAVVQPVPEDPRQARGTSVRPTFSRGQLDAALIRNGIPTVEMASLITAPSPEPTSPSAGAVPGPSISPLLLGRFYPFLRPMTGAERAMVAQRGAVHYTPSANLPSIVAPDGSVSLLPSTGYRNLTDPGNRQSAYFFAGEPTPGQYRTNLAGGPAANTQGVLVVQGADLPEGTLFRPIDNVLSVPGGYRGPAQILQTGESIPAGNGVALSATRGATSMAEQLRSQGSFSGHPLATGAGAGVIAVVLETGVVLVRTGELPSGRRVMEAGIAGMAGGVIGGVVEQGGARVIATTALGQVAKPLFVVLGRGGAGAVGGFIAAPVVEMGRMALDDQVHTGTDYAARGTRAAVAGGLSGALAAGATAAVAGSVAPGVGTAIGFVVGVGAYLIIDWIAGDAVEAGVRAVAR